MQNESFENFIVSSMNPILTKPSRQIEVQGIETTLLLLSKITIESSLLSLC